MPGTERAAFENYLQAAIVFGRSVYHYLQSLAESSGVDAGYLQWFHAKSAEMKADPVFEYFRESRDLLLKERKVAVRRRVNRTVSDSTYISAYAEVRVTRAQPWYRQGLITLWQDAMAAVTRPIKRWRYRLREAVMRRRRALRQWVEAWRTQRRYRKAVLTVREFYVDDPAGLDRPAVDLVRAYLDRLEAIVAEAETHFPTIVEYGGA